MSPLQVLQTAWQQRSWADVSGACGDLGTFLPLLVAMTQAVELDLGTTLIWTGAFNIVSGLAFDLPLPVQPMKAIAALAISSPDVGLPEALAAGAFVGGAALLLGATNLIGAVNAAVPRPILGGMQLAMGLELAQKGLALVWFEGGDAKKGVRRPLLGADSLALGLAAAAYALLSLYAPRGSARDGGGGSSGGGAHEPGASSSSLSGGRAGVDGGNEAGASQPQQPQPPRTPAALVLAAAGVVAACIVDPGVVRTLRPGPTLPRFSLPTTPEQWQRGILLAGLPQLPLTLLNSVVAVSDWARDRFPTLPLPPTAAAGAVSSAHVPRRGPQRPLLQPWRLSALLGGFNVAGAALGSMPACNGVGGLAAQTAFGARSGAAPVALGAAKIALGLAFGSSLLALLSAMPGCILGAMLVVAGVELAGCSRGHAGMAPGSETLDWVLLLLTAALCNLSKNVAVGVSGGVVASIVVRLPGWVVTVRREGVSAAAAAATGLISGGGYSGGGGRGGGNSGSGGGGAGGREYERRLLLPSSGG